MTPPDEQEHRSLSEAVLDLEGPLTAVQDLIIALDLIASGSLHGIDSDDMRGLKAITRHARDLGDRLRMAWSQTLTRAEPRGSQPGHRVASGTEGVAEAE